ncbi:MAG: helix-turn-helix domain-containing protein [Bacteroidales bacterium]|nr:helix-turn-helix domain-containing protein [Bacteroidales bacterium]
MEVILISGIFMSFFIVVLLLTKKQKALTDKILAVWLAVIGIHLLGYYSNQLGYWEKYPHLIGLTAPVPLFHGPFLYLYCLYAFRGARRIRVLDYLHFVPGAAAYLYMMKFFLFYSPREKLMVDQGVINDYGSFAIVLLIAILISGLGYSILSHRLTTRYTHKIDNYFSYNEGISLRWLRYCIVGIGLVFLSAIIVYLLRDAFDIPFSFNPEYIIYTILIIFIFYLGYYGIKHENIFISQPQTATSGMEEQQPGEKYKNSGMTSELAVELYGKLVKIMEHEKPYLEPKLSLSKLAEQIGVSPNHLSQVINQEAKANFHDFVNSYRVEEFLQRAEDNRHFSFLALESGFNSKSSFNYIFKKQKGQSPSRYLSKKEP